VVEKVVPNGEHLLTQDELAPIQLLLTRLHHSREQMRANHRLQQSERMADIGKLANSIAHQLNNPLTVVLGYADMLLDDHPSTATRAVAAEARRMKTILENMSRFSHSTGEGQEPLHLGDLVNDAIQLVQPEIDENHIEFRLHLQPSLPSTQGKALHLRQALLQLLRNSIQRVSTLPAEVDRSIRIEVTGTRNIVQLLIVDNGQRVDNIERIFDPLEPGHLPNKSQGLGLGFVNIILREHRGSVSAYHLHPRGIAIALELPAIAQPGSTSPGTP
jgi:C4-dicarboxylate-specific signal transduction histidine kinase